MRELIDMMLIQKRKKKLEKKTDLLCLSFVYMYKFRCAVRARCLARRERNFLSAIRLSELCAS